MDEFQYNPGDIIMAAKKIGDLRDGLLFGDDDFAGADPESEQYFLLALSSLETAQRYLKLAAYRQARALR